MTSGVDLFLINSDFYELKGGRFIKANIKFPPHHTKVISSMDFKMVALGQVDDTLKIYELIDRQFILKHQLNPYILGVKSEPYCKYLCGYINNVLVLRNAIKNELPLITVIDLTTSDIIFSHPGEWVYYCDGILTIIPVDIATERKYINIDLSANYKITRGCPYFMEKSEQILQTEGIKKLCNGIFIHDNDSYYHAVTGKLILCGPSDSKLIRGNYIESIYKLEIQEGAPVVEYIYEEHDPTKKRYIYVIGGNVGTLTKAAPRIAADEYTAEELN